jgi:hypothetical protein
MTEDLAFSIASLRLDENYRPSENTRVTTNFANLARGECRAQNLRNALTMIDNRCNALAHWDNPRADRYSVELDIISVGIAVAGASENFPAIEMLQTTIVDHQAGRRVEGIVGNNFSSYVRDYDFSVLLPEHNEGRVDLSLPDDFGDLHGKLFRRFVGSPEYAKRFSKPPVICLSVSHNRTYRRTANRHPVLGIEYRADETSLTDRYFGKMGLQARYFMPPASMAPLAFYCSGDLLRDYTDLELVGTISTMETFQKIYRPEIYNANSTAGECFRPSLQHQDYSLTRITYDREERSRLARTQGRFAEERFIKPHRTILAEWCALYDPQALRNAQDQIR